MKYKPIFQNRKLQILIAEDHETVREGLKLIVEAHKSGSLKKLNVRSRKEIIGDAILQGWMRKN